MEKDNVENGAYNITHAFKVDANVPENEFLRACFINLARDQNTPTNVLTEAEKALPQVERIDAEYLSVDVNADINYSCLAGVDRVEEYVDRSEHNGQVHYEKRRRTVTDWSVVSGSNHGEYTEFVINSDENVDVLFVRRIDEAVNNVIESGPIELFHEYEYDGEIKESAIDWAKSLAKSHCFRKVAPPKYKDEKYDGKAIVGDIRVWAVPAYKLEYKNGEDTFEKYSPAISKDGTPNIYPTCSDKVSDDNRYAQVKKIKKTFGLIGGIPLILAMLFFVVASTVNAITKKYATGMHALNIIGGILLAVSVVVFIALGILIFKKKKNIDKTVRETKKRMLEAILQKYNFRPLTDEENGDFN